MKRVTIVLAILLLLPTFVSAHPGRTASDGCHYCRTNCEKWGVPWGKRHCHNRDSEPLLISEIEQDNGRIIHFRKSQWGMSKKETSRSEKLRKLDENQDRLFYKGEIAGLKTIIAYEFLNGKLAKGFYLFSVKHSALNKFIEDYASLDTLLEKKYGKPKNRDDNWIDSSYKPMPEHWGYAISKGHLSKFAIWESDSTMIFHILHGDNNKISHIVEYSSKFLSKEKEKVDEEKTLDDL